ncbi:MAG: hypothetical protein LBQ21_07550 [Clostridiales Family XIII bacterium]|jgi:3D (Asp-Asp-Asp) domain-containing protein|nr:hypothetical protein [Clostridiales Family XIII bacterium]
MNKKSRAIYAAGILIAVLVGIGAAFVFGGIVYGDDTELADLEAKNLELTTQIERLESERRDLQDAHMKAKARLQEFGIPFDGELVTVGAICGQGIAPENNPALTSLGSDWTVTFYTDADPGVDRVTSTGADVQEGLTVAVDPSVIPYGSEVYLPELDMWLVAEDCGGAIKGHRLDVFVEVGHVPDYGVIRGVEVWVKSDVTR